MVVISANQREQICSGAKVNNVITVLTKLFWVKVNVILYLEGEGGGSGTNENPHLFNWY